MLDRRRMNMLAIVLSCSFSIGACTPEQTHEAGSFSGDPARGYKLASEHCMACHGTAGGSSQPGIPRLGEQWPEYLQKQLKAFAAPAGAPNHRANDIMEPIAKALSDQDMADLAAWYAQNWRPSAGPRDAGRVAAGRELFLHGSPADDLPACASCHRPTGTGIRPDFPNLAGQDPDYVEHQLTVWEATRGHRGKLMSLIVPHMRPEQRAPLADFIATLKSKPVE